jgi:hypothetical protein
MREEHRPAAPEVGETRRAVRSRCMEFRCRPIQLRKLKRAAVLADLWFFFQYFRRSDQLR